MGQLNGLGAHTFRSGLAALSVRIAQALLSLISVAVLARLLTPEDFGVVAMVVPFVVLANGVGNQGFQTTLLQAHDLDQAAARRFFGFALRANLAIALGFIAVGFVLGWFYEEPRVRTLAGAWAVLIWLLTLTAFQEAMLKRELRFPVVLGIHLVAMLVGVLCGIAAAVLGAGYWSLFVQALVVEVIRAPSIYLLGRWLPAESTPSGERTESLDAFWRALAGFRVASWASEQPDRILVGRIGGAQTLGLYDTALRWSQYAFVEPFLALTDVAVVSLSRVRQDAAQYRLFFARESRALLTIGLPAIAFVVVEPGSVVRVLLGPQWDAAVPYVRLLGIAAFFSSFTRLTQWVYFSSGTTRRLLRWWLVVQTPALLVAVLAGSMWGARGVAVGYTMATVALALPSMLWSVAGSPVTLGTMLRAAARPAVAAVAAALVLAASSRLLPIEAGAMRLIVSLGMYAAAFIAAWLAAPGGTAAAGELLIALRELKSSSND